MADGGHMAKTPWYSAAELVGKPGMPGSERGVLKRAERERWESREKSFGKGREYALHSLPQITQAALRQRRAAQAAGSVRAQEGAALVRKLTIADAVDTKVQQRQQEQGLAKAAALTGKAKQRMDARIAVLATLNVFAQTCDQKITAAIEAFCKAFNAGQIDVEAAVREEIGNRLNPATVREWRKTVKTQGPAALGGCYGWRKGSSVFDTDVELHEFVIGAIAALPTISAKLLYEGLCARFKNRKLPVKRSLEIWLANYKRDNAEAVLAATNPDAWKNKYKAAFGSLSEGITRACQLWMMDSTPADLLLIDGRHTLVGVVDIAFRGVRLHVSKTSSAEAVSQLTRRAILEWGVPEAIKMDNGSDYKSERFAQLLAGLHIEPHFSAPFSPWEKGNIERAFRTFSHSLLTLLPGYIGHNVAEAQAIRARASFADRLFKKNEVVEIRMTAAELQDFCDRWCKDYYAHEAHEGLGGITPFQKHASLRDVVRRIDDVRALDLLLGEGLMRTVTKKGLKIERANYIAPELATVIGQQVLVRVDDADVGRAVVYHNDEFLCIAECPEIAGVSRQEIAIEAKARQTKAVQSAKQLMRDAKKKANVTDLAYEILDHKAQQNAALSSLPAPNVVHLTPALEAAAQAVDALESAEKPTSASVVTLEDLADLRDAMRREQVQDETSEQRFRRALDALMKPEAERNDIERRFLKSHCNSPEFKGRWSLFEDFGPHSMGLPETYSALLPDGAFYDRVTRAQLQGE